MTGWLDSILSIVTVLTNMASLPSTSRGSGPSQQTYTAEQALQMIWDRDDSQDDLLSDDSLEHDGKGSDDEEIADDVCQLLVRLPQHKGNQSPDSDSSAERASVDFECSERLW